MRCRDRRCKYRHPLAVVTDKQTRAVLVLTAWKYQVTSSFGVSFISWCEEFALRNVWPDDVTPLFFEMNRGDFSRSKNKFVLKVMN